MSELVVLYNSVCPVCREGICMFERRTKSGPEGVRYYDVSAAPDAYANLGVTLEAVRRKLHAVTPEGDVIYGWPAVAALWSRTPGFKWLAIVGDLPVSNWFSRTIYHVTAQILWWWNRGSGRW